MNFERVNNYLDAPVPLSPDGERYFAMARGVRQPRPFMFRVLVPYFCQNDPSSWRQCALYSFAALAVLGWWYTGAWAAVLIPFGLAGLTVQTKAPVLVDLPAMALALASACCFRQGWYGPAVTYALLAGATKETAPLFAAAYAWSPLPLVGLLVPACIAIFRKPGPDTSTGHAHEALVHPIKTALATHRGQPFLWFVLPLGVLVLGLAHPTWQVAAVLLLAYGQLIVATDLVRLYVWAWPVLALNTFHVVPRSWWLPLVVLHLASPHRGEGW